MLLKAQEQKTNIENEINKEVAFQNYKRNGKRLASFVNDSDSEVFKNKKVLFFDTIEQADSYIKKNKPELVEQNRYSEFLEDDNITAAEMGDIAVIVEGRIKNNLSGIDLSSANAVHHEVLHFILNSLGEPTISKLRKSVEKKFKIHKRP